MELNSQALKAKAKSGCLVAKSAVAAFGFHESQLGSYRPKALVIGKSPKAQKPKSPKPQQSRQLAPNEASVFKRPAVGS